MEIISWRGNIESRFYLQAIISLHQLAKLKDMEGAIFRLHETKYDDPIMAATNLFGNITNIHPFEDGNGRVFRLILAQVLM